MFGTLDLQIEYLLLLQNFRNITHGFFDQFFIGSTWLGEIIIPITFLSVIYWGINKKIGTFLLFSFGLNLFFNVFIKLTACINRPWILDKRVCPIESVMPMADGYSFPSGHTAGAMSVWGTSAFCFWKNKIIRYLMIFLVCLVAFSRNYVGVHTPQDVLVSIIIGIFVIFVVDKLLKWIDRKNGNDTIFFVIITILGLILCTYLQIRCNLQMQSYDSVKDLVCPLLMKHSAYGKIGFFFGIFTGWYLERKFINFEILSDIKLKKIFQLTFGIILLFIISFILKNILTTILAKRFIHLIISTFAGLHITFLYPMVLKRFSNNLKI